jgi:hypothetical protein
MIELLMDGNVLTKPCRIKIAIIAQKHQGSWHQKSCVLFDLMSFVWDKVSLEHCKSRTLDVLLFAFSYKSDGILGNHASGADHHWPFVKEWRSVSDIGEFYSCHFTALAALLFWQHLAALLHQVEIVQCSKMQHGAVFGWQQWYLHNLIHNNCIFPLLCQDIGTLNLRVSKTKSDAKRWM